MPRGATARGRRAPRCGAGPAGCGACAGVRRGAARRPRAARVRAGRRGRPGPAASPARGCARRQRTVQQRQRGVQRGPPQRRASRSRTFKDRFLAEIQRTNRTFYSLHVAQAQRIDVDGRSCRLHVRSGARDAAPAAGTAARLARGGASVAGRQGHRDDGQGHVDVAPSAPHAAPKACRARPQPVHPPPQLTPLRRSPRSEGPRAWPTMACRRMLDVFPAEIRDVEEIK